MAAGDQGAGRQIREAENQGDRVAGRQKSTEVKEQSSRGLGCREANQAGRGSGRQGGRKAEKH